jgi:hypothetical protein
MSIPRHQQHFISSSYDVHVLTEVVSRWNISAEELFWGTGVETDQLQDLSYKISLSSFKKVITRTIELTKEDGIGFYAATQLKISSHGLLGLTAAISKNALDTITTINQFVNLQCSFVELNFEIKDDLAYDHITYEPSLLNLKSSD